jgi:Zn-dependent peptidase ImmA (M78 family)
VRSNKQDNARIALEEAIRLRQNLGHRIWDAISPFECAENLGIEVRFVDIPSLEGMYSKGPSPIILVSSLRPLGRVTYSCAHEIAHHVFDHGTHVDADLDFNAVNTPEEFLAQTFAGFFLMPKLAIERAIARRGWNILACTPEQIYRLSCWFGVGYETLISHMEYGLKILPQDKANELRDTSLDKIKASIVGRKIITNLVAVDNFWTGRAIDVQVGDKILFPTGTLQSSNKAKLVETNKWVGSIYEAIAPGIEKFYTPGTDWSVFLRVARKGYIGRSIFRFLEDPDYEYDNVSINQ